MGTTRQCCSKVHQTSFTGDGDADGGHSGGGHSNAPGGQARAAVLRHGQEVAVLHQDHLLETGLHSGCLWGCSMVDTLWIPEFYVLGHWVGDLLGHGMDWGREEAGEDAAENGSSGASVLKPSQVTSLL